jgi:hypothetical protein
MWTKECWPKEDGFYWYLELDEDTPTVLQRVTYSDGSVHYHYPGSDWVASEGDLLGYWWSEKLIPPKW